MAFEIEIDNDNGVSPNWINLEYREFNILVDLMKKSR